MDQESLDVRESRADEAVKDKSELAEDNMKLAKSPAKTRPGPSTTFSRVNLAGKCAEEHPGQCEKSLWVGHATDKVDQQRKIISWEKGFMGQDYEAGTKEQVKMDSVEAEVVTYMVKANPGVTSVDEKTVKKLDGFLSFFHSRVPEEETRGCTTQCTLLVLLWNTWGAMRWLLNCSSVEGSCHVVLYQPAILKRNL